MNPPASAIAKLTLAASVSCVTYKTSVPWAEWSKALKWTRNIQIVRDVAVVPVGDAVQIFRLVVADIVVKRQHGGSALPQLLGHGLYDPAGLIHLVELGRDRRAACSPDVLAVAGADADFH